MKKSVLLTILMFFLFAYITKSQVFIDTISLVANEETNTQFCFNNTKLMAGNSISDRYIVYYNVDTIFLNVNQSGIWNRKVAYTGNNIQSATLSFYKDTIWLCWKEGFTSGQIKARYTSDKGISWSTVLPVSPIGKVSAPSIFASSNGKIHFVWSTDATSDTTVYHNRYSNGAFLPSPTALSNSTGQGLWPSVIAIGDTVLCSWKELPPPSKVWFRSSYNGGDSWNTLPSQPTTNLVSTGKDPNLSYAYDSTMATHYVYLAFVGQNNIYLQRSTDLGNSWSNPTIISSTSKLSQFAHLESNNYGFVGVSYEQRPMGASLFDDTKKDVGFTYSSDWGSNGSFSSDTLAYTFNGFGSAYTAFNKIDNNTFYLAWLTKDTINNVMNILERLIYHSNTTGINTLEQGMSPITTLFPNPFSVETTLRSQEILNDATLTIYNTFGQELKQIKNISGNEVTLLRNNLPSGTYFIRLTQNNKASATVRVLITD